MKKNTIQSGKFYVSVPHDKGEALFEFSTQEGQDNFIQEIESRGEFAYALTPLQIKLEVHKQLSLKYMGGIAYITIKRIRKEISFKDDGVFYNNFSFTIKTLLTELSPYLFNYHGSSEDTNLQIHIYDQLALAIKWKSTVINRNNFEGHFTSYLHRVCNSIVDHKLTPPKKQSSVKKNKWLS